MSSASPDSSDAPLRVSDRDTLLTLYDLGRRVTEVLHLDDLLAVIPKLLSRLIEFDAFAVYLLDAKRGELGIAYSLGYPPDAHATVRLRLGSGLVGRAVAEGRPLLVGDLENEPLYVAIAQGMRSTLVVPLVHKGAPLGALNILSRNAGAYTVEDVPILRQFGTHVAAALANARLFERERRDADVFEALAEIGREVSAILDLDELLTRIAQLARRVIDYRTFGIMLLDERSGELEMRLGLKYGERIAELPRVRLGEGLVGYAAQHRVPVSVPDVSADPRYIRILDDVRSELVVPLLLKDRCIGVFDVESPELDAFDKQHVEILTLLAGHAAVAIENARLYEAVRDNEARLEKEVRFAQRVQMALLPAGLPKRVRGIDVAARFEPARELGGDFYDFLDPEANSLVVALGDVSGKGVPAALYSAFAGELVRSRTFRRRFTTERTTPAAVLAAINQILNERGLEEFYCTLCYANFDVKRRVVTLANSGLPFPIRCHGDTCESIALAGVPLGSFPGITYEEAAFPLAAGDLFVFCSDGVFEAFNERGEEFTSARLLETVRRMRHEPARAIVDAIFAEVAAFRGDAAQSDDMTAVALRVKS
jgi:sigma-B regulation protein RsbU (phosphoserine phosphatase)